MSIFLKIKKLFLFFLIFTATVNTRCNEKEPTEGESNRLLAFSLATSAYCENKILTFDEPNDDFNHATCLDKFVGNFSGTVDCSFNFLALYPPSDKDYLLVTANSGSFRYYAYIDSSDYGDGLQFFDINQSLIYDKNDTNFNSKSSVIVENRLLTKDDCDSSRCNDDITKYRLIRFETKVKQIYLKFYIRNIQNNQNRVYNSISLLSTTLDKSLDPSNYGNSLLQGDIKPCK